MPSIEDDGGSGGGSGVIVVIVVILAVLFVLALLSVAGFYVWRRWRERGGRLTMPDYGNDLVKTRTFYGQREHSYTAQIKVDCTPYS